MTFTTVDTGMKNRVSGLSATAQTASKPSAASYPDDELAKRLAARRAEILRAGSLPTQTGELIPVWPVGLTEERAKTLLGIALREKAVRAVETGFALGMSASVLLEASLRNSPSEGSTGPRVVSIDPFQSSQWKGAGERHLRSVGAAGLHSLVAEGSELVLPRLCSQGAAFDLAFVDGDHRFEHVMIDVYYASRLLGPGRVIVVDDAWMPSVRKACAFFESADLCVREVDEGVDPSGKLVVLRITGRGVDRAWDHFADF